MRKMIATLALVIFSINSCMLIASADSPVVHAVLFFSPSCSHCHKVLTEDLPPITNKYGKQLRILAVDISEKAGSNLYQTAVEQLKISDDRLGVPTLIVGNNILVGSSEIPDQFPQIVQSSLSLGGTEWPEIPGLTQYIKSTNAKSLYGEPLAFQENTNKLPDWIQRFLMDPKGNSLAVITLVIMLVSVITVSALFINGHDLTNIRIPDWLLPLISVLGLGVAFYLSFVEVTKVEAFCGPVGDCNSVQKSPYAILFGILPVGILGLLGYLAIILTWIATHFSPSHIKKFLYICLWGFAWFGILFSIYLTFLEPFVIGATCAWCVSSALIMTLIYWITTPAAFSAFQEIGFVPDDDENESQNESEEFA